MQEHYPINQMKLLKKICANLLRAYAILHGISYEVSYKTTCPVTFNESKQAESAIKAAMTLLGEENSNGDCEPRLFSEDFSIMSKLSQGALF